MQAITQPGGFPSVDSTADFPEAHEGKLDEFQARLESGDFATCEDRLNEALRGGDDSSVHLAFKMDMQLRERLTEVEGQFEVDIINNLLGLINRFLNENQRLVSVYHANQRRSPGREISLVDTDQEDSKGRATPLHGIPAIFEEPLPSNPANNDVALLTDLALAGAEERRGLVSALTHSLSDSLKRVDVSHVLRDLEELSELAERHKEKAGDTDLLAKIAKYTDEVQGNNGYPTGVSDLIAKAQAILDLPEPTTEQFGEAFSIINEIYEAITKARNKIVIYGERIKLAEEGMRQAAIARSEAEIARMKAKKEAALARLDLASLDNLYDLSERIDTAILSTADDELGDLHSKAISLRIDYDFNLAPKVKKTKKDLTKYVDESCSEEDFERVFDLMLKEAIVAKDKLVQKFEERLESIQQGIFKAGLPSLEQDWFTDGKDLLGEFYDVGEASAPYYLFLEEEKPTEVDTHRKSIRASLARPLLAAAAVIGFTGAMAYSLMGNNGSEDAMDDSNVEMLALNAPDIDTERFSRSLENPTTSQAETEETTPSQAVQAQSAIPSQIQPNSPSQIAVRPAAQRPLTRTIIEVTSEVDSGDYFRFAEDEVDISTILDASIADSPSSAIGDMSRRGLSNNSRFHLRSDLQGQTSIDFRVATLEDPHVVRSMLNGLPVDGRSIARNGTFTATPLLNEDGTQASAHIEGRGWFPIAQVDGTDNFVILTTYTQTLDGTASIDPEPINVQPEQSVDELIEDLFRTELASQTETPQTSDPELAELVAQADSKIQMPTAAPVIPDFSTIPELDASFLTEVEDDQDGEYMVIKDEDIIAEEDYYEEVDEADIIDEAYELTDADLIPVDQNGDIVLSEADLEEVKEPAPTQQAKGFFSKAASAVKRGFRRLFS